MNDTLFVLTVAGGSLLICAVTFLILFLVQWKVSKAQAEVNGLLAQRVRQLEVIEGEWRSINEKNLTAMSRVRDFLRVRFNKPDAAMVQRCKRERWN